MVGEIRDAETAAIAVQSRADRAPGHQHHPLRHLSRCVHAADQHGNRAVHAGVERAGRDGLAAGAQQLPELRATVRARAEPVEGGAGSVAARSPVPPGHGLRACNNNGFSSRLPVTELLAVTEPFREAVLKRTTDLRAGTGCHPAGHAHAVAKRPATRRHRPDDAGRNHPRGGVDMI